MYSDNLKNYLNLNLHVNKVYMNEDGGWLFYPHPSYRGHQEEVSEFADKRRPCKRQDKISPLNL